MATHDPKSTIWRDRWAWTTATLIGVLLLCATAPAPTWLDSGELIAAARELGGIHPPGHPAWLSLAPIVEWLPLGPYSARVAWFSALFAAISVALMVRIARMILGDFGQTTAGSIWAAAAAASLGASSSLWLVSVRVEVYTLALACNLWALYAALRAGDAAANTESTALSRATRVALMELIVAVGLGVLNHHYITLFLVPALIVAAWPAIRLVGRHHRRAAFLMLALGLLLSLGYLGLTLRALTDTEMRWGDPATAPGLWDTLTAQHFQRSVTAVDVDPTENAMLLFGGIANGMGLWLAALGALGLALGWLRRDRLWLALLLTLAFGLLTKALMIIDLRNPDDHGYVLMAVAALALGIAMFGALLLGDDGLLSKMPSDVRGRLTWFIMPWVVTLIALNVVQMYKTPETNLRSARASDVLDNHVRSTLSPGSLYLGNYYGLVFNEQAFRIAEGRRPDISAAHISFRTGDTDQGRRYQRWFAHRRPEYTQLAIAAGRLKRAPIGNFLSLRELHNVYVEADPENRVPFALVGFNGLVSRLLVDRETTLDYDVNRFRERRARIWDRLYQELERTHAIDHQTRSILLWQHALQIAHALRRGWRQIARDELERARSLNPRDRLLDRLESRIDHLDAAWKRTDAKAFKRLWLRYTRMDLNALTADDAGAR